MKLKLTTEHYAHDRLLPEGTIVGDGTPYPFFGVSQFMEPLDEEAAQAIEFRYARRAPLNGDSALFPGDSGITKMEMQPTPAPSAGSINTKPSNVLGL